MQDHKLLLGLQSLSKPELHQFELYVQTPFFNQSEGCMRLLELLLPFAPDFTAESLQEAELFAALFPGRIFHAQRLREYVSKLFFLLKRFLAYQEYQAHPYQEEVFALTQFRKRKLDKAFQTQLLRLNRQLEAESEVTTESYRIRAEVALQANGFYGQQQLRVYDRSLQDRANNLDLFYLISKLRESCEMLNRKHVMNASYDLYLLPALSNWLTDELPAVLQVPAILIYLQIYRTLTEAEAGPQYEKLVSLLAAHHAEFSPEEARGMYKHAQNHCIRQINQGNVQYQQELFDLYQAQLANERIFIEGSLSHTDYKNIATVGLRVRQFAWVHHFLDQYQEYVLPPFRMNVYNYCLASLHLEQAHYDQAIRLLQQVNFTDLPYRISAQYLLLKAYYETEEWDSLEYMIKAFGNFLRRNKGISPENRRSHQNFLRILRELLRLQHKRFRLSKSELDQLLSTLLQHMDEMPNLPHIEWLKEKAGEVE